MNLPNIVPLSKASWCMDCLAISDSSGEQCLACGASGSMLSLARILAPSPEIGRVTYVYAGGEA